MDFEACGRVGAARVDERVIDTPGVDVLVRRESLGKLWQLGSVSV
jgi:hypothetical protein